MEQYIKKSALVAEIEKRISRNKKRKEWEDIPEKRHQLIIEGQLLGELKHFLDSLEVKEVDLQKDSLTWEDIPNILIIADQLKTEWWFVNRTKDIGSQAFWEEVLKRFKAQKGE
jgi:hypothetical protein